jgi:predicted transcriptional regulator
MLRQDVSQVETARLLGVSQSTVSQWMQGRDPSLRDAVTLELVTHVPVRSWLR